MRCKNCGKEIAEGSAFCTECGTPVEPRAVETFESPVVPLESPVVPLESPTVPLEEPVTTYIPEDHAASDFASAVGAPAGKKKKPVVLIIVIILLLIALIAGGITAYFMLKGKGAEEEGSQCKNCSKELEEGYYCDECLDLLTYDYNNVYCRGCVDKNPAEEHSKLHKAQVYHVGKYGALYCKDCDTGRYCVECNGFVDERINGDVCWSCCYSEGSNKTVCSGCRKVVTYDESVKYVPGRMWKNYCADCDSGRRCNECGDTMLEKDDDDSICWYCSEFSCNLCYEVLDESEVGYINEVNDWQYEYCKSCDTGKYCESCGMVLEKDDDDSVCYGCANRTCYTCNEVLSKNEVAYTYESEHMTEYYCKECNTGKFCTACEKMLGVFDIDTVCSSCADITCGYCDEVITEEEISYSYENSYSDDRVQIRLCKRCDTGKYCEGCNIPMQKDDDDNVCSSCAKYSCYWCSEVLGKEEISHKTNDGEHVYCNECDKGRYCVQCGVVIDYDDAEYCYGCAPKCSICSKAITDTDEKNEDEYGSIICDDCVKHCENCGEILSTSNIRSGETRCYDCRTAEYYY